MNNYNTKLMEILAQEGNIDEFIREEIEHAVNTLLELELEAFLGYAKHDIAGNNTGNSRNGSYSRTIHTRFGDITAVIPRDRKGDFTQHTLPPYKRSTDDLENMIVQLYRKGITTDDIVDLIEKMYGHHYTKSTISNYSKVLLEEVEAFHKRQLSKRYVVIYADATYINVRRDCVDKEALHVLVGITEEGEKEVLDYALYPTESSENYREMFGNIHSRGVEEVLLIASDGLTGFRDACKKVFPKAEHQSCWVHIARNVEKLIRTKDRKEVLDDLKLVYKANDKKSAEKELELFQKKYEVLYPKVVTKFEDTRSLFSFFLFPEAIRNSLYTTNLIENLNKQLKKITKRKEQFPNEKALDKCAYCFYCQMNDKFSERKHKGFEKARFDLNKMFEEKYGNKT